MKKVFFFASLFQLLVATLFRVAIASPSPVSPQQYFSAVTKNGAYNDGWKKNFPASSIALEEKSAKAMATQENKRKLASDLDQEFYESKMSSAMKKFRLDFLAVKNADDLDRLLKKGDLDYDSYPADLQFIIAQLAPLQSLRGIIWKLVPTVQNSKSLHSLVLTQVKSFAVNLKILLPTDQWQAGFDYLTQPYLEKKSDSDPGVLSRPFARGDEAAVQSYVRSSVIPAFIKSVERIEKLDISSDLGVWDNKLLYGTGSFSSNIDRYALFGEVERHAALSNIYAGLSELCYQSAFSAQGSLALSTELGKLYGWDGFISEVDGVPASKRVPVIKKYSNWGRIFSDGEKWTADAFMFLIRSVEHGYQSWEAMKKRPVSEMYIVSNANALPFQRPISNRFDNLRRLTQGLSEIRSTVTDEKINVNIKEFYINPPRDLKSLYAIGFENSPEMMEKTFDINGKKVRSSYRNFLSGRAIHWNLNEYKKYFPDIKTDDDLIRSVRILSQGWGTFIVAMPFVNYLN